MKLDGVLGRGPGGLEARFWRETALVLLALGLFNGGNYAFHVVVSRLLGPSDYGALASLLAVVMVLSVPFGVLQTMVAHRTASMRATGREAEVPGFSAAALRTLAPFALVSGAVVLLGTPLLASFLHLGFGPVALLGPYVVLSVLCSVAFGVLQGQQRFGGVASLLLAGVTIRLAVGIVLVGAGFGVTGAVLATVVGPAVTLVVGLRLVGIDYRALTRGPRILDRLRGNIAGPALGLTSFWLFAEVDVALARHFLANEEAGFYSSAGLLARGLLFLPAAVALVAFPRFVTARERGEGHTRWLRLALVGVAALLAVALPVLVLLRRPLVSLAFGEEYLPGTDVVPPLGVAMALMSLLAVLVYFHIAMGSRAFVLVLGGVVVETVLIAFWHDTAREIALVVLFVAAGVTLLEYAAARSLCRWRPPLERASADRLRDERPTLELSVVLPCHNAGLALRSVLEALAEPLRRVDSYEVIVVSDGSTDDTVAIAEEFASDHVRVLHYDERSGKGNALRVGLTETHGRYVAFLDADGDIAPQTIESFLALMKLYEPDVVLGSKRHPLSEVHYPPVRRLLSWSYHKLTRLLFRINVRDTQTGLKLIRRDVLTAVLPRLLEKRYAFDVEFLVVARSLGYRRVFEAPIKIEYRFASQVNLRAAFRILLDTVAIFYRHYLLNTYRQAGRPPESALSPGATLPIPDGGSAEGRAGVAIGRG